MLKLVVCSGIAISVLMLSMACGRPGPTSPSGQLPPAPVATPSPTPRPPVEFPPASGPSRTFSFDRELAYPVRDYTRQSRFVLYDNGAFVLEYHGFPGYRGRYRHADGVLQFLFIGSGRTVDEAWDDAIGTPNGDALAIEFELMMQHSDFENAVYRLWR
jgi:hypothetical protein